MLGIQSIDHVGVRIGDRRRSVDFYQQLGFGLVTDTGFEQGHPVIMRHACGVVLNLLGPRTKTDGGNILMDVDEKYPGYTHIALRIASLADAKTLLARLGIAITGSFSFGAMNAIFIRDPDRNVIELDEYGGGAATDAESHDGYGAHPDVWQFIAKNQ